MSISQQVVSQPPSGDIKYVDGPSGTGDGSGMTPGTGTGDGGGSPPVSGGGDGGASSPPVAGGGGGSSPPVAGGGDGGGSTSPPVVDGGDGSTPPGAGDGGGTATPPIGDTGGLTIGIDPVLTVGANGSGLSVNVLTPADATDSHGITVNVLGNGTGDNLLDIGLLPNSGGLGLPGTGTSDPAPGNALGLGSLLSVDMGSNGHGLGVNVLAPPDASDTHGINLNVLDNGSGENLLDVGLLPNTGGISLPGTGGSGTGNPLGLNSLLSITPSGTDGHGLSVNALAGSDASDTHGLNLNVLDNGNGEHLLDVGLLPNTGGISLPSTGEAGSGNPLGLGSLLSITPSGADGQGLSVNALTGSDATDTHGLNVNLLDTGDGHNLLDVGVLPNAGLGLSGTGETGTGNLLGGTPLLSGVLGQDGGLLNGTLGDLSGSSTGHLVDLDIGPQTPNGLGLDVLSTPGTDPAHAVSVNAVDVGPDGPHLLDLGALTGAGILDMPTLGGAGADGLTGNLLGTDGLLGGLLGGAGLGGGFLNGDIASGNTVSAPVTAPLDLAALTDIVTTPLTGDHGLLDLHGAHIL